MAMPLTKVSIGKSGYGAAHASYITRLSAIDPAGREREQAELQCQENLSRSIDGAGVEREPSGSETLDDNLNQGALRKERSMGDGTARDADPIWAWNAPQFLTGERYGTRSEWADEGRQSERSKPRDHHATEEHAPDILTLAQKVDNVKLYFRSREEFEKRKGGRTHYRIILSFDVPATNRQIRELSNDFLGQVFPNAIAFGAIHRDTDHPHVHIYLHSRQIDGRRIQLKNHDYKSIDEKWAKIYAAFAGDRSLYIEHLRKKEETRQWKIAAAEAYRKGEPIPPKPERDSDRREKLSEQRLSAQKSEARDRASQLESRPQAEPVSRAASEKETSRLLARTEVAREQLAHLIRTDAAETQIKSAARIVHDLSSVLDKTVAARKEIGRARMPQAVYTTEEWKQLKGYRASTEAPVKDDQVTGRLQAGCVLAGAEMRTAQEKVEAFRTTYQFWKFDVEGWDRPLSLVDVIKAINAKSEEKLKLYNFLRPGKRDEIQGQIDYLRDVKRDIQKQLSAKGQSFDKNLGAAEVRYQIASQQVEETQRTRASEGRGMPAAVHTKHELDRMEEIATRDKNGDLLLYVWDQVRDRVLSKATPDLVARVKGWAVMARLDMVKEKERLHYAVCFGEFRQIPYKDKRGFLETQRLTDVTPKNALEAILRHFTDSVDQKQQQRDLADSLRQQASRAQERAMNARQFSEAMDWILAEHCNAVRVSTREVVPVLNQQQIAELRDIAHKLPTLNQARMGFQNCAQQAEQLLQAREADQAARQEEQTRSYGTMNRSIDQASSPERTQIDRSERGSYSRGR